MSELTAIGKGWHFAAADGKLGFGDGRKIVLGEALKVEGKPKCCEHGLHCSERIIDALRYAQGPFLQLVEYGGQVDRQGDKLAAEWRRPVWIMQDSTPLLRLFARWCAIQVLHLWNAPDVVKEFLRTGDESSRAAARAAARAAQDTWLTQQVENLMNGGELPTVLEVQK